MNKLKIIQVNHNLHDQVATWEHNKALAEKRLPLKGLKNKPSMVAITKETKKFLKLKALKWMATQDKEGNIRKGFLKHPFKYGFNLLRSLCLKQPYRKKEGDLFLYGIDSCHEFEKLLQEPNTLLVVGFSFCHKPFECPSGRFSSKCQSDPSHLVCQQCFIGKCFHFLPKENNIPLSITTVHYIGHQIFKAVQENPTKKVLFIISACELTLTMFGDLGNMVGIQGIGIRLGGRICNTMQAFCLAEEGIKPGLTIVEDEAQEKIFELIKLRTKMDIYH